MPVSRTNKELLLLNDRFANHAIPDDWMDIHLAHVTKPEKDHTSIQGYRITEYSWQAVGEDCGQKTSMSARE